MILLRPRFFFPLLSIILLAGFGCKKSEIQDSKAGYPIDLSITQNGSIMQLDWTATNLSDFESYIILRSSDSLPDDSMPNLAFQLKEISDEAENTFTDDVGSFGARFFYKIYVKRESRFLYSQTVEIQTTVKEIKGIQMTNLCFDPDQGFLYVFDRLKDSIYMIDVEIGEIVSQTGVGPLTSSSLLMKVGNLGFGPELYVCSFGNTQLTVYDATNLNERTTLTLPGSSTRELALSENGVLFALQNSSTKVVRRKNWTNLASLPNATSSSTKIALALNNPNNGHQINLYEFGLGRVVKTIIDSTGTVLSSLSNLGLNSSSPLHSISISPDGKKALVADRCEILDLETLAFNSAVNFTGTQFFRAQSAIFSQDMKKIRLSDAFSPLEGDFDASTGNLITFKNYPPGISPSFFFPYGSNYLFVTPKSSNSVQPSIILSIGHF